MSARRVGILSVALLAVGCGGASPPVAVPPPPPPAASATPPAPAPTADLPATHPEPTLTPPFQPPAPAVYTTASGITVWLLERHALPVVSVTVAVPSGSSNDPKGEAGLASLTAQMLEEGAGKLPALEFAKAVDQLGATLTTEATPDATFVRLNGVKRTFAPAMQLLGDAVARPRFDAKEWKRVHDLWMNDLKERASEPREVAAVVRMAAFFGSDHPYAHPVEGLLATAPKVTLPEAKRFYAQAWRPDRAIVVAVGDLTKAELDAQLDAALAGWKAPSTPPLPIVTPPAPVAAEVAGKNRVVFVDRPDAPQAVVSVMRASMPFGDPRRAPLERANVAIGGSFTSRINGDLREKRGWTYSAGSVILALRGVGAVRTGGSFVSEHAVEALKALLGDMDDFAQSGLTDDELTKTRLHMRGATVSGYETVEHASALLARDAAFGLPADWEAKTSVAADVADKDTLNKLAAAFYGRAGATIVIVGPRAKLEPQLLEAGFGPIEAYDAEGSPVPTKGMKK